ncbi:RagB/SusD family nutrient uptake outer membrane protein [Nonlabens antarcticus]|uniref:RagB/SusD family nutrient uptake outer membrane protein n=1 Tax=Nonlabens antarcticus TaxID=392714 RepID=UPI00189190EE|nr:RagB/SusD family nutrient uptake outer membrane protein [Nonlabens antarcticus]
MKIYKYLLGAAVAILALVGCEDTLDLQPRGEQITEGQLLSDPAAYEGLIAKVYGGITLGGQGGGDADADIQGIDGGFSSYTRNLWKLSELPTDEAVIAWGDEGIQDFQRQQWSDGNQYIRAMYSRITYQVALANDFLKNTTEAKLDQNGIQESDRVNIRAYRNEARFLRAFSYYHGMDMFGGMPFQDETTDPKIPGQLIERADLFTYIESELLDIEDKITPARMNPYGRADQATVWMTLAKLYLNADVYTGTARNTEVITYTEKVITAGYSVDTSKPYQNLFLADNGSNGSQNEFIWTINYDGLKTRTFGGTTFLTHAPVGGKMDAGNFGINGGWAGIRTTPQFVELFPGEENSADGRELFFTQDQTKKIADQSKFTNGFAISKFKNVNVDGTAGSDPSGDFVDIDFPVFRLADAYLMYAEANLRGGGGSTGQAVNYINILRERAYGNSGSNIAANDLNLTFILAERGRELYWETHRRQDLIRFNQFSVNGTWAWKGNVQSGITTPQFRDLFPVPAEQLNLNDNLIQNPGY